MKTKIFTMVFLVFAAACFMGDSLVRGAILSNSIVLDEIEYYIQTDKEIYNLGEDVEMLYRVRNLGDEEVSFSFGGSPVWNFWVDKDGDNNWRAVNGWYWTISGFTLASGESIEFPALETYQIWDMRDSENNLVGLGQYDVIGGLDGGTSLSPPPNNTEYDFTKVSVLITIIPEPATILLFGLGMFMSRRPRG